MYQPSSFGINEQSLLQAIEAKCQQILAYIQAQPANPTPQWLNGLDGLSGELQALSPQAAMLSNQGRPLALEKLQTALSDLQMARAQCAVIVQSVLQTQWNNWRAAQDANSYATANSLAATNYSNASFARSQQGFFDVTEDLCYDCHRSVNIPGGGYCLDCARRRGLIW